MEEDIQNYSPTDRFRGTRCMRIVKMNKCLIQYFFFFSDCDCVKDESREGLTMWSKISINVTSLSINCKFKL